MNWQVKLTTHKKRSSVITNFIINMSPISTKPVLPWQLIKVIEIKYFNSNKFNFSLLYANFTLSRVKVKCISKKLGENIQWRMWIAWSLLSWMRLRWLILWSTAIKFYKFGESFERIFNFLSETTTWIQFSNFQQDVFCLFVVSELFKAESFSNLRFYWRCK